jgi:hypothetical protein
MIRLYKDEALAEIKSEFKAEASDTVKLAIAKIFYAKREFMQEINKVQ